MSNISSQLILYVEAYGSLDITPTGPASFLISLSRELLEELPSALSIQRACSGLLIKMALGTDLMLK